LQRPTTCRYMQQYTSLILCTSAVRK